MLTSVTSLRVLSYNYSSFPLSLPLSRPSESYLHKTCPNTHIVDTRKAFTSADYYFLASPMNVLTQHDLLLPLLSTSILCFYSITRLLYCTAILRHQRRHHLRTVIGRTDTALHRLRMMYITCLSYVCLSSIAPRRYRLSKLTWPTFQQRYFEPCNKSNEAKKRTLRTPARCAH